MRRALVVLLVASACSGSDPAVSETSSPEPGGSTTVTVPAAAADPGTTTCWSAAPSGGSAEIEFSDATQAQGLVEPLVGMHGHATVVADIDGDDRLDLFVGTFGDREPDRYRERGADGPSPDRLLLGGEGGFSLATGFPDMLSRTSGGAAADLDGDGDLDLILSRNWDEDTPDAPATQILRNDGGEMVVVDGTGLPVQFGGRSVGVLDYDLDGLPDLFLTEDRWSGGNSALFRNVGALRFEDVTTAAGIPPGVHGLGVAVADLSGDGRPDVFVGGSNRLFVAQGDGTFIEADSSVFQWETYGEEDDVAGVAVADVNRDGRLDLALGHHYGSTVEDGLQVPVRLYLNSGSDESGMPGFEDVTEQSGLVGLPTKAPHVELADFDNDGWPDLLTSASSLDGTRPAVFRHLGLEGSVPRFSAPEGLGQVQYWVAGATADVDRDGRLDVFLVEWEPSLPSLLLANQTASGHWLEVSVAAEAGFGIGWRVEVFRAGEAGSPDAILGVGEITVSQGYSAGVPPVAHFGLGELEEVALRVTPVAGSEPLILDRVQADQHLRLPAGCG